MYTEELQVNFADVKVCVTEACHYGPNNDRESAVA
jgi:hypothetical protein